MENLDIEKQTRDDIFKLIKLMKKTKSKETYNNCYNDIEIYNDLRYNLGFEIIDPTIYTYRYNMDIFDSFARNYLKSHIKSNSFDEQMVDSFMELDKLTLGYDYLFAMYKNVISLEDSIKFCEEFYNEFNPEINNILDDSLKRQRIFSVNNDDLLINNISGYTSCGLVNYSPYIVIGNSKTISDTITLEHELAHVYVFNKIKGISNNRNVKFLINDSYETYSLYSELIIYDFLEKKYGLEKDIHYLQKEYDMTFIDFNLQISEIENFNFKNWCDNYNNFQLVYSYARGYLLGYYFYDMYKEDPERANYNINNYLLDACHYDFLDLINRNGLNRERIESLDAPKKYVKKHFEIK